MIIITITGRHQALDHGVETGHRTTEEFIAQRQRHAESMLDLDKIMHGMARWTMHMNIMTEQVSINRKAIEFITMCPAMCIAYLYTIHTLCYPQTVRGEWGVPPSTSPLPIPAPSQPCK